MATVGVKGLNKTVISVEYNHFHATAIAFDIRIQIKIIHAMFRNKHVQLYD